MTSGQGARKATPPAMSASIASDGVAPLSGPLPIDMIGILIAAGVLDEPSAPGLRASLDRFEIRRTLGVGGMGVVLLAFDPEARACAAIKVLKPELTGNAHASARFLEEARLMYKARHKNLLEVREVKSRPQGPYYVMAYMDGGSLADRIHNKGRLENATATALAHDVASALAYLHSLGIVHQDVKSSNVLLNSKDEAVLCDLGLARLASISDAPESPREGTLPYMSPRAAGGKPEEAARDIYALGVMLYEMLTGQLPFAKCRIETESPPQLAVVPKPIVECNPAASLGLARVAEFAMAAELRNRYARIDELMSDLDCVARGAKPVGPTRSLGTHRGQRAPWMAFLVATATVGLIVCILVWYNLRPIWAAQADRHIPPMAPSGPPTTEMLQATLFQFENDEAARAVPLRQLQAWFPDPVPKLIEAMDDPQWRVRHGAEMALHELAMHGGDHDKLLTAVPKLKDNLRYWQTDVHLGAFDALTAIAPDSPEIYLFADRMSDPASDVVERKQIPGVFEGHRPAAKLVARSLARLLRDPEREVRGRTVECLVGCYPELAKVDADELFSPADKHRPSNVERQTAVAIYKGLGLPAPDGDASDSSTTTNPAQSGNKQ